MTYRFDPSKPIILRALLEGPRGSSQVRLLLDTGAVTTMLRPVRLRQLGLEVDGSSTRLITTASGVQSMALTRVTRLTVGGQAREEMPVLAHDLPPTAEIDGLLGMDFLQDLHVSIRMRQGLLTLEKDDDAL